ncbi:hypothetical protein [Streptomyces sp. NPDC048606]|uniref:hypothetical protein n=1 Tax=Streptomyces sp. NPDC048606 TaxID=3154726 RepID=UPI003443A740
MAQHLGPLELIGDGWVIGDPGRKEGLSIVLGAAVAKLSSYTSWYAPGGNRLVQETIEGLGEPKTRGARLRDVK